VTGDKHFWAAALLALAILAFPGASAADWEVYVSGGLGISTATGNAVGQQSLTPNVFGGSESDSSPMVDGAVGLEVPMDELVPRELLVDVRLPDWPVRMELEAAGFREYELRTYVVPATLFFSQIETTTVFFNTWLEIPLTTAYKPAQYVFGLGRQPRVRQFLTPAHLYFGVGIGYAHTDLRGVGGVFAASDEFDEFAWNAGVGIDYALTDFVDLSAGYRFVCLAGEQCMAHDDGFELTTTGGAVGANDYLEYDVRAHEFRVQVRVEVFEFLSPWR